MGFLPIASAGYVIKRSGTFNSRLTCHAQSLSYSNRSGNLLESDPSLRSRASQELLYLGLGDHPHKGCCDLTVTDHENRRYPPNSESFYQFPICCHHQTYHSPAFCLSCNLIEDGFHPPARRSSIAVKLKQDRVRFRCLHYLLLEVAGPELPQHAGNIFRCFGSGRSCFTRPRNLWGSRLLWDRNNSFRGKVYFSGCLRS